VEKVNLTHDELLQSMEIFKQYDKLHAESGGGARYRNIEYVEREEPEHLVEA